jgi:hypothetical protein
MVALIQNEDATRGINEDLVRSVEEVVRVFGIPPNHQILDQLDLLSALFSWHATILDDRRALGNGDRPVGEVEWLR